jgi:hypothetical protein
MTDFFSGGGVAGVILAFMAVELVLLAIYRHRTGAGFALADVALTLVAGAGLVLALGAALTGASWPTMAACLLVAMTGHCADVYRRFLRG